MTLRITVLASCGLGLAALLLTAPARGGTDSPVLARVNGEPIALDRFLVALDELHADAAKDGAVPQKDPTELLQRLVDVELILQEARAIGLDDLPDYDKAIDAFRKDTLRGALLERIAAQAPRGDPKEVERVYRERAAEVEISSVEFAKLEHAQAFFEALRRGDDFAFTARTLVEQQRARNQVDHGWFRLRDMLPEVVQALAPLAVDGFAAPVPLTGGFAVMKRHGSRVADDPELRKAVERELDGAAGSRALLAHVESLRARYLTTDEQVLSSLDFDANPERFDAFLEDERVVVQVKHGEPVRVRDIARTLETRMFHGIEQAAKGQRLNKTVPNVIEELTTERILQLEAQRLGLDRDPRLLAEIEEYERAILFGLFVRKAIDPSVEVRPAEIQTYYDAHVAEYTSPEMARLDTLAFADAEAARRALEHLRAGADLGWMRENAEDQAPAEAPAELRFDRHRLVQLDSLPAALVDALAGAAAGDFRLWSESEGRHLVLALIERVPPKAQPLAEVRESIARSVFADKREAVVKEWKAKLRAASEVEILVDAARLRSLLTAAQRAGSAP
jgi:hypothetical protein